MRLWGHWAMREPAQKQTKKTSVSLGHRLISAHPDSCSCEFDEAEVVGGVLLVAGRDGPEVLELVEEALDEVPVAVEEGAKCRLRPAARQRLDVGERALLEQVL